VGPKKKKKSGTVKQRGKADQQPRPQGGGKGSSRLAAKAKAAGKEGEAT